MFNRDYILLSIARHNGRPSRAQHERNLRRNRVFERRLETGQLVAMRGRKTDVGHVESLRSRKAHQVYFVPVA